jgi:hypothetical protein
VAALACGLNETQTRIRNMILPAFYRLLRVCPGTFLSFAEFSDHEAYGSQTQETEC